MLEDTLNQYHDDLLLQNINTQKKSFEGQREGNLIFSQQLQHHNKSCQKNLLKKKRRRRRRIILEIIQMFILLFQKVRKGVVTTQYKSKLWHF